MGLAGLAEMARGSFGLPQPGRGDFPEIVAGKRPGGLLFRANTGEFGQGALRKFNGNSACWKATAEISDQPLPSLVQMVSCGSLTRQVWSSEIAAGSFQLR